jgi:hypothetical protein
LLAGRHHLIDEGDIYGDGVNVAARLERLAEPGRICVSRVVRDQVRDKLDFTFDDKGEQQVKNITRPASASSGSSVPPVPSSSPRRRGRPGPGHSEQKGEMRCPAHLISARPTSMSTSTGARMSARLVCRRSNGSYG